MANKINLLKFEFEYRIFISLGIVCIVLILAFVIFDNHPTILSLIGGELGINEYNIHLIGYLTISAMVLIASLIRMWAGSLLSSHRVMSFKVQSDYLTIQGPYKLVRNPIYFSDMLAICCFSLCLHPAGIIMPVLFYFHYSRLIKYEEESFKPKHSDNYKQYLKSTPKLIPSMNSIIIFIRNTKLIYINKDGFRHNALFILFIPGLIVSAFTSDIIYTLIIGIPAVVDWAIIHSIIGINPNIGKGTK